MRAICHHRSSAATLLKVCLILGALLSQAGWGHSHDHGVAGDAEHIARYHGGDAHAGQLGFHWHFGFPLEAEGETPVPHPSIQQLLPCVVTERLSDSAGLISALPIWPGHLPMHDLSCHQALFPGHGCYQQLTALRNVGHSSVQFAIVARLNC